MKNFFEIDEIRVKPKKERNSTVKERKNNNLPLWFTSETISKYKEIKNLSSEQLNNFLIKKSFEERCGYILSLLDNCLDIHKFNLKENFLKELLFIKEVNKPTNPTKKTYL